MVENELKEETLKILDAFKDEFQYWECESYDDLIIEIIKDYRLDIEEMKNYHEALYYR